MEKAFEEYYKRNRDGRVLNTMMTPAQKKAYLELQEKIAKIPETDRHKTRAKRIRDWAGKRRKTRRQSPRRSRSTYTLKV
jgi:hypothetical protein